MWNLFLVVFLSRQAPPRGKQLLVTSLFTFLLSNSVTFCRLCVSFLLSQHKTCRFPAVLVMRVPVRWVLWDVKDTLLKVRRSVGVQYCSEAERAGLKLPPAQVETAFRQAYRQQSRLFPNYGRAQGMSSQVWWTGLVRDTFAQCGVDDPALLDRLANNLYDNFCGPENWEVRSI